MQNDGQGLNTVDAAAIFSDGGDLVIKKESAAYVQPTKFYSD